MSYLPDYFDAPPETDPAPVECTACGRTECVCGQDPFCTRCLSHHARDGEAEERCQEVSRFVIADHRRRGGEG